MGIELTKKDVIWSYVGTAFSMASNLLMLPFLILYLDSDALGMWYVFSSIGAVATLFDFGFSVTFARNITYCWSGARELKKEDVVYVEGIDCDYSLMNQVLVTCKILYAIISVSALILLVSVGTIYIKYVGRNLVGENHIIAWIIYATSVFLNLYYGYYASFLRGVGAVDRVNKNTIIARIVQISLTIILLLLGEGLLGASIAYLSYGVIFRILGKRHFYRYKEIGKRLKQESDIVNQKHVLDMISIVWHNAWRDGVISVTAYLCNQASTVICSMYLSLQETGVYSIGVQISTAIAQIAGTLYNAYQPELQSAYINKETEKVCKVMSIIVMSFVYLFILGTFLTCVIGLPILRIIRPEEILSTTVLLGLCVYQFILKLRNCYTTYFSCTNRIIYLRGFVVASFLCVVLSICFMEFSKFGVWGLIISQIISQIIYNIWKWPFLAHKELKLSLVDMINEGTRDLVEMAKRVIRIKGSI